MIRVFICDDQEVVCEGLRIALESYDDLTVMGIALNAQAALTQIEQQLPDVVLMDLKMPGMLGTTATYLLRQAYPDLPIIALTTYRDRHWVFDALRSGANGYIMKDSSSDRLVGAIRGTLRGETHIDPSVAGQLLHFMRDQTPQNAPDAIDTLTSRELEVLRLVGQGISNGDIASTLHLSEGTVKNYISSIYRKLKLSDRIQVAIFAIQRGIV